MPDSIWMEVVTARLETTGGGATCEVQLKGDRGDSPTWWPTAPADHQKLYGEILAALDRKHPVLARLTCKAEGGLTCDAFRFLSAEAGGRIL